MFDRHIEFERCANLRDLGGYATSDGRTVRWRRLFRGMSPQYMTADDVRRARGELGIRTVIDLRGRRQEHGSGPLGAPPARRLTVEFDYLDDAAAFLRPVAFWRRFTELNAPAVVATVEALAGIAEGAALMHCAAGRDRTGIVVAAILKLLGVSDGDVIEDYMHSVKGYEAVKAVRRRVGYAHHFEPLPSDSPDWITGAVDETWIDAMLGVLRERGGAKPFLVASGASEQTLNRFRDWALE